MKTRVNYPDSSTSYKKSGSDSKVLIGLLAGVATGAILGVLFAPEKGEETRRKLAEGSQDLSNNLKGKLSDLKENVADKYQTVKQSATDLIEQGKTKASNVANALKSEAAGATSNPPTTGNTGAATFGTSGFGAGITAATTDGPDTF